MITVQQAFRIATEKAAEVLDLPASNLEEFDKEDYKGREVWSITLSFPRDLNQISAIARLGADPLQYKRFLVDVESGLAALA